MLKKGDGTLDAEGGTQQVSTPLKKIVWGEGGGGPNPFHPIKGLEGGLVCNKFLTHGLSFCSPLNLE